MLKHLGEGNVKVRQDLEVILNVCLQAGKKHDTSVSSYFST